MNPTIPLFLSAVSISFSFMLIMLPIFSKPRPTLRPWVLLLWASVFLGVGFGLVEYAVWLNGENLFSIVFTPNVPLLAFFLAWVGFLIWLFEKQHGKRAVWIALLIVLVAVMAVAMGCMDCLRF